MPHSSLIAAISCAAAGFAAGPAHAEKRMALEIGNGEYRARAIGSPRRRGSPVIWKAKASRSRPSAPRLAPRELKFVILDACATIRPAAGWRRARDVLHLRSDRSRIFAPAILTGVTIAPQISVNRNSASESDGQGPGAALEPYPGLAGWCVMGMETLNSAVRAAGFAMAACDEPYEKKSTEGQAAETQWRPGEAVLPHAPAGLRAGEWVRSLLGLFGRRAPASSA